MSGVEFGPRVVWKFPLNVGMTALPRLARPVTRLIGLDPHGLLCAWVEHDLEPIAADLLQLLSFVAVGTGHPDVPPHGLYSGSVVLPELGLVLHFYESRRPL